MTPKSLLYHIGCKLGLDVYKLSLEVTVEDNITRMEVENNGITLGEINMMLCFPKLCLFYNGSQSDIGSYQNEDIYSYFNYHCPIVSTNEHNSSTEAVAEEFVEDRNDFDMDIDTNSIVENLNERPKMHLEYDSIELSKRVHQSLQSKASEPEVAFDSHLDYFPNVGFEEPTRQSNQDAEMGIEEEK